MKMIGYLYLGFIILSFILIFLAYKSYRQSKKLIELGIATKAEVVDFVVRRVDENGKSLSAVLEYVDATNTKIVFTDSPNSNPALYKLGDKVDIIYLKDNSLQKVVSFWGLYRGTIVTLCLAAPFFIIGGSYMLYTYG